jgi:hypothetical protein
LPDSFRIDVESTVPGAEANFQTQLRKYKELRPADDTWPTSCPEIKKKGPVAIAEGDRLTELRIRLYENCLAMHVAPVYEQLRQLTDKREAG